MDFKKLIQQLATISEAGTNAADPNGGMYADNPEIGDGSPTDPPLDNITKNAGVAAPVQKPHANAAPEATQLTPEVLNIVKQLSDISTKLFQLNKQSIESGKYESATNIEKALLESFGLLEADLSMTGQRNQLMASANQLIKQLEPYKNDPRVADAISTAQRGMQAPAKPADLKVTPDPEVGGAQQAAKTHTPSKQDPATVKLQQELKSKGYDLGNYGQNKDGIDGIKGGKTLTAIQAAKAAGWDGKDINNIPAANGAGASGQAAPAAAAPKNDPNLVSGSNKIMGPATDRLGNVVDQASSGWKNGGITGALSGIGNAVSQNWSAEKERWLGPDKTAASSQPAQNTGVKFNGDVPDIGTKSQPVAGQSGQAQNTTPPAPAQKPTGQVTQQQQDARARAQAMLGKKK